MGMMTFVPGAVSAAVDLGPDLPGIRCFCLGMEWGVIGGQLRGRVSPLGRLEHRITPLLLFTSLRSEGSRPVLAGRSPGWRPAVRRESEKELCRCGKNLRSIFRKRRGRGLCWSVYWVGHNLLALSQEGGADG